MEGTGAVGRQRSPTPRTRRRSKALEAQAGSGSETVRGRGASRVATRTDGHDPRESGGDITLVGWCSGHTESRPTARSDAEGARERSGGRETSTASTRAVNGGGGATRPPTAARGHRAARPHRGRAHRSASRGGAARCRRGRPSRKRGGRQRRRPDGEGGGGARADAFPPNADLEHRGVPATARRRNARRAAGHREVVRLSTRNKPSKGGHRGERGQVEARVETGSRERGEPHDRHRGATNPEPVAGASRRGGAKPQGRNTVDPWSGRPEGSARALPGVDGGGDVGGGVTNRRRGVVGENRRPAWRRGSEDQERHEGGIRVGNEADTALQQDPRSRRTARWARRSPDEPQLQERTRERRPRTIRRSGSCSPRGEASPGT